ncbi:MAG TPA: PepSY-associated TM helix domain-containing protein [Terriglobia bacterium]|nr:PepSY-associated TM helix domain-containing protein [Terriglobia bacterium]
MKHMVRVMTHWALLAHIYVSMAGFTLALLFGITGVTLNHQDFGFGNPRVSTSEITLDRKMIDADDRAAIEEALRQKLGIRSPSTDYHGDADQIDVTFAAPGGRTIVAVNRADGRAQVEKESRGILGKLDDLHKGLDSGSVWYWTIDAAGLLLVISSLTGMVTLVALRARRRTGFAVCALGVLSVILIYIFWIPK